MALLGTERKALSVGPGDPHLTRLLAQIDLSRTENAFLSAAAVVGLHEEIGRLPGLDQAPAPAPCEPEELPRMSARAGSLLWQLLGGEFSEMMPECLALAAGAGWLALPEALPGLLSLGGAKAERREAILPLLGKRGRWLAAQNPEWSWAVGASGETEDVWQVGESPARWLFLQHLRRTNPARALELLNLTWKEESPEDRGCFIAVLEAGLSVDDEPFLEAALNDKRKEVRKTAAVLLARLPGSGLVTRMIERVGPLLKFTAGQAGSLIKLQKAKPAGLEISLPVECDKSMQRDGIEPKPQSGFGEKIGWLIQMLEAVPLTHWTATWDSSAAEIIEASLQGEWKKEMFEAWTSAAVRQKNAEWAEPLLSITVKANRIDKFEGLLAALPARQRELRVSALLESEDARIVELQGTLVAQCPLDWSLEFSQAVLAWMRKTTGKTSSDWQLRSFFKQFAASLAVAALDEAGRGWPTDSADWEFWAKGVDEFLASVQFRSHLHAAFSTQSPVNPLPP